MQKEKRSLGGEEREWAGRLIEKALEAREYAYVPYSKFAVGAALLSESGNIFTGCNVENAAFGPSNCAERTAFFKAVSEGERRFTAIAIVGGSRADKPQKIIYPCGVCRQVMVEFCRPDFRIICAKDTDEYEIYTLEEMIPNSFDSF